jgi:hypothetical protein
MVAAWPGSRCREDVEDHVGRVDALGHRLCTGRFDRQQSIGEYSRKDCDHLAIAVIGTGKFRRTRSKGAGSTQSLNGAPLRKAPGLRARIGT